jgi:hypothetical protein
VKQRPPYNGRRITGALPDHHQPAPRVLPSDDGNPPLGGRAIGAYLLGWHISDDLVLCQCCSDVMEPGEVVVDVELHGERLHVCAECGGLA